jgi:hypothetical protein
MERSSIPRGILVPLITPFDADGELDVTALGRLTDFYAASGVQAIFALGPAGQGLVMTPDQRRRALETIIAASGRRVPVIAHVGTADAFSGRELARHAAQAGADAIAIVPPFYYSDHTEFEIVAHTSARSRTRRPSCRSSSTITRSTRDPGDIALVERKLEAGEKFLNRLPSEYVREHFRFSTQPMCKPKSGQHFSWLLEIARAEELLLYSSDWPHATFDPVNWVFESAISEQARQAILSGNARKLFTRLG